jgi:hypothetical protein
MGWDLAGLLIVRGWLLIASGWGLLVMYRLYRRGSQLDFPIVPPPLVKLTAVFLAACFVVTAWITVVLFASDEPLMASSPVGVLGPITRTVYGASLVYALSCTLWIINVGIKGYRHGPKVDQVVLEAIVRGLAENTAVEPTREVDL